MIRLVVPFVAALAAGAACGSKPPPAPTPPVDNHVTPPPADPPISDVVSKDMMQREPIANTAKVKHILIGWKDLGEAYGGRLDPRAAGRTKAEAENVVRSVMAQIKSGADFDALMKKFSEDPGSASSAREYTVAPDAQLVIEFRLIGLRLKVGEIGVVESDFGFHIVKRTE
jgi:peptidyl-prolyl cis-trans isomerase D